jgi:hypothetical protein
MWNMCASCVVFSIVHSSTSPSLVTRAHSRGVRLAADIEQVWIRRISENEWSDADWARVERHILELEGPVRSAGRRG